jgi:hypothetical protein
MSGKKISFAKPQGGKAASLEEWVNKREITTEPLKRLTIEISNELHRRLKSECAIQGKNMKVVVTQLIEDALALDRTSNS